MIDFKSSADLFQNQLFRKVLSEIPPGCQTLWIQTILLVPIWVPLITFANGLATKVAAGKVKVKSSWFV